MARTLSTAPAGSPARIGRNTTFKRPYSSHQGRKEPSRESGPASCERLPAAAPLIVPDISTLPQGFFLVAPQPSMQEAVLTLARDLAEAGLLELAVPHPSDTPDIYLARQYVRQHQAVLSAPEIHIQCVINRNYGAGAHLDLIVTPRRRRYVRLSRLHAQLSEAHPELFGAVVSYLKTLLAPYDPLFTADDAVRTELLLYYHDDYASELLEDYQEAHPQQPEPDILTAAQWAASLGRRTHLDLKQRFPPSTYQGTDLVLGLLDLVENGVEHISAIRAFIEYLERLPKGFLHPQEWYSLDQHPGEVTVVMLQARGVDPVAEAYDDLTEMFGEIHSEYAEPIQLLGIADAEDHKLATEYFQLVAEVQRRTAAFWDLVADSE